MRQCNPIELFGNHTSRSALVEMWSITKVLLVGIVVISLLFLGRSSVSADVISDNGSWIDCTYVPATCSYHTAQVSVERYWPYPDYAIVYWQDFGGSVNRPSPDAVCYGREWHKKDTYYSDDNGNQSIGGWSLTSSWCGPSSHCRSYHSDQDFWLYGYGPGGHFQSQIWFTNECFPNWGDLRSLDINL